MSEVTVRQMAQVLGLPVEKLLEQLSEAGMSFSGPDQIVTSTEKVKLLGFLRRSHGKKDAGPAEPASPQQITLRRKTVSEITVSSGAAKGKTVAIEVRQKRTYVKRSVVNEDAAPVDPERENALRLLKESADRNTAEQNALREIDDKRRRVEEEARAAEAAKRAAEEEAQRAAEEDERQRRAAEEAASSATQEAPAPRTSTPSYPRSTAPSSPRTGPSGPRTGPSGPRSGPGAGAGAPVARAPHGANKPAGPPRTAAPARPTSDRDEPHRHKGVRGSHRMQEDTAVDVDPSVGRYLHGELHLADRAPRRARKRPKARVDVRPVGGGMPTGPHGFTRPVEKAVREVAISEHIQVSDLANRLAVKGADVVKALFKMGVMTTINQIIDHDTAVLVVEELGHKAVRAVEKDAETQLTAVTEQRSGEQSQRPPVVTIMGHVDHGKTSLLDYIRRTKVAAGEAGGITQHIGAYHVETPRGVITFLDTPGHAAFTAMRARGAKLTDIVILVVAADDGVMPQTIEAVHHAKAAGVPLIVAVNKIDKPDAQPERVKQGLIQHEVVSEEFGGDTIFAPVSAKTGQGVDELLEAILLQAEVMQLTAIAAGSANGTVVESALDKGRGPVATLLVQSGILKKGDFVVCGVQYGRVRAMFDESGRQVDRAGPSIPVSMLGLSGVPDAGDDFIVVADERLAKDVAQQREQKRREMRLVKQQAAKLEDIMAQMGAGGADGKIVTLNLVVKADVQGSSEALRDALTKISTDQVKINVMSAGVGGITESDATLALASQAIIIAFNVRADAAARKVISDNGLDVRYFSIIYDAIDQVKQAASGLLGTEVRENVLGVAEVREVFRSSKFGVVAGCMITEGMVKRNKPIKVLRDNVVVFNGELESLRRFKDQVDEVKSGMDCGIGVKGYNDIKVGDQIECFDRVEVQRTM